MKACVLLVSVLLVAGCDGVCFRGHTVTSTGWRGQTLVDVAVAADEAGARAVLWRQGGGWWTRVIARGGAATAAHELAADEAVHGALQVAAGDGGYLVVGRGPLTDAAGASDDAIVGLGLDGAGRAIGPRFVIASARGQTAPALAWDGARHLVAAGDAGGTWVRAVSTNGVVGAAIAVGPADPSALSRVAIAARDHLACVAWTVRDDDGTFTMLAARLQGGVLLDAAPITIARDLGPYVVLAAGPRGFMAAGMRNQDRVTYALPISRSGALGVAVPLPSYPIELQLVAAGDGFVLATGHVAPSYFPTAGDTELTWLAADGTVVRIDTTPGLAQTLFTDGAELGLATLDDDADDGTGTRTLTLRTVAADGATRNTVAAVTSDFELEDQTTCEGTP